MTNQARSTHDLDLLEDARGPAKEADPCARRLRHTIEALHRPGLLDERIGRALAGLPGPEASRTLSRACVLIVGSKRQPFMRLVAQTHQRLRPFDITEVTSRVEQWTLGGDIGDAAVAIPAAGHDPAFILCSLRDHDDLAGHLILEFDDVTDDELQAWRDEATTLGMLFGTAMREDARFLRAARAREDALAVAESRQRFLANMSHEIRTPLNGVIGMTELLLSSDLDHEQLDHVRTLRSSAETLLALINDILDHAKIESGKLRLESIPFDLSETVEDVAELLRTQAHDKGVEIIADIDPELPALVQGDPVRIRQILTNLTSNSVKFTEQGEVVVQARVDKATGRTQLAVRDTGIGIPADRLNAIFDNFSQAESSTTRRFGGTGLGLSICRQLCELMGGSIRVDSAEGVGSCFSTLLDLPAVAPQEPPANASRPLEGRSVLVVDDNSTNRRVLRELLIRDGCRVIDAPDGPSALEWVGSHEKDPVDLVLLDMHMPSMNGLEVARKLSVQPTFSSVPIFILSSATDDHEANDLQNAGVHQSLLKPIRHRQLVRSIEVALGAPGQVAPAAPRRAREELPQLGLHILLAEDNIVNQKVATRVLAKLGCTVDVAVNGLEAVAHAAREPYDVILMDVQMPQLDGLAASRLIRQREGDAAHTPIVAMTAHALDEHRKACSEAGMDTHIGKPFEVMQLVDVLRDVTNSGPTEPTPSSAPPR